MGMTPCKIKAIGKFQLQMHDRLIRDLTDVWYVPDTKINHISLETLVGKGMHITLADSMLNASKYTVVVIKSIRKKNLFYL